MKKNVVFFDCNDKKIPITFNINVMEEIQSEYGSVSKWTDCLESADGAKIKDLKFGLGAMINEAIDMLNDENGTDVKLLNNKQIGRMLSEVGFQNVISTIQELIVESTKTESESETKNE